MNPQKTILVVDDSSLARRAARTILQEQGYRVEEASDGAQAIERYFLKRPDLVLLNMVMSGMYGLDVLAKLRELDPAVLVIVVTADIQTSTEEQVRAAGAAALLNKPVNRAKLLDAVVSAMEGTRQWN